ncbi:sugar-transfer associated ATP-grasp domain-containing protein [Acidiphilium sp.]|uniref:sugar-transfer associated ATP-grasp domain-containing protein n=1 Tax=Acidiphilium sp. TaxID=527 RepID=UPI003D045E31
MARLMVATYRLSRGPGRLMPVEFFQHRLWDRDLMPGDRSRFVGLAAQGQFHRTACDYGWRAVADDKLISQATLSTAGISSLPETVAVAHPTRCLEGAACLRSAEDIIRFLRDPSHYPWVAKPIDGVFSVGVMHGISLDPASDMLCTVTGASFPVPAIAARIHAYAGGYLIQRALQPLTDLGRITGGRLCTVRVLVLLTETGPIIHRAAVKIPIRGNEADNYWREGNRLGAIDLATGEVTRVMTGKAASLRRDPIHPDTGCAIEEVVVPDWQALCALVVRAAPFFPGIRTQSWDVAISDRGPILLELNWGGDLYLHQIAHGAGVLDDAYCTHLRACGFQGRLPG